MFFREDNGGGGGEQIACADKITNFCRSKGAIENFSPISYYYFLESFIGTPKVGAKCLHESIELDVLFWTPLLQVASGRLVCLVAPLICTG